MKRKVIEARRKKAAKRIAENGVSKYEAKRKQNTNQKEENTYEKN